MVVEQVLEEDQKLLVLNYSLEYLIDGESFLDYCCIEVANV